MKERTWRREHDRTARCETKQAIAQDVHWGYMCGMGWGWWLQTEGGQVEGDGEDRMGENLDLMRDKLELMGKAIRVAHKGNMKRRGQV